MQLSQGFCNHLMQAALQQAEIAAQLGEVPVGAVLAFDGQIIAAAHNQVEALQDSSAHAEILVMRQAAKNLKNWRLNESVLCVTLEPCTMCAGAIRQARVPNLIFGAEDPRAGAVGSLYDLLADSRLGPEPRVIKGILNTQCAEILSNFFAKLRKTG